jgi:hypothetical protein
MSLPGQNDNNALEENHENSLYFYILSAFAHNQRVKRGDSHLWDKFRARYQHRIRGPSHRHIQPKQQLSIRRSGQSRIRQEDILSFEVITGSGGYLVFDLTDTIVSPLIITVYNGLFYFDVDITDADGDGQGYCDYLCDNATFSMYGNAMDDYTHYAVHHESLLSYGEWSGFLQWPSGATLLSTTEVPVPAAAWLFLSGLVGVAGAARLNKAA